MKRIIPVLGSMLLAFFASAASAQTLLVDYGSADPQAFTLIAETNTGSFTQGLNTGTFSTGGLGVSMRGSFSDVDLTAMGTPGSLQLNLTFNNTFSGTIDYLIGSVGGNVFGYSFTGAGLTGTQTISFLRNASLDEGTVVLSAVNRVTVTSDNPNFTLNTLSAISAVPEPSTYAAFFGIVAISFCALRRRRKV
jgi:hypothetical protein